MFLTFHYYFFFFIYTSILYTIIWPIFQGQCTEKRHTCPQHKSSGLTDNRRTQNRCFQLYWQKNMAYPVVWPRCWPRLIKSWYLRSFYSVRIYLYLNIYLVSYNTIFIYCMITMGLKHLISTNQKNIVVH